jgi:secreted trypsin-like serine protease
MSPARAVLALFLLAPAPAAAMLGGEPAPANVAAQTALIVSTRGASCTGAVLARDLVLTAAHCVQPSADYAVAIVEASGARVVPVVSMARVEE